MTIKKFDQTFISLAKRYFPMLARVALFVIFFYFGLLKLIGLSPAEGLAATLVGSTVGSAHFNELFVVLSLYECLIGMLFLFPKATRTAILLMLIHLLIVSSPLVLVPDRVWAAPLVPNLEGQYIIKNIALLVVALGLVANTPPLPKKSKTRLQ